jgi:hypothetical protein
LTVAGCADIRAHLTLNRDGSADLEQRITVEQSVAGMIGGLGKLEETYQKQGYQVKLIDEGQTVGVIATKHLPKASQIFQQKNSLFKIQKDRQVLKITRNFFMTRYQINGIIDLKSKQPAEPGSEMANALLASIKFKFILTLPVKPEKHNAGTVSADGKTLEWLLVPGKENSIQVEAKEYQYLNIGLLIIPGLLVLAGIALLATRKPKPPGLQFRPGQIK